MKAPHHHQAPLTCFSPTRNPRLYKVARWLVLSFPWTSMAMHGESVMRSCHGPRHGGLSWLEVGPPFPAKVGWRWRRRNGFFLSPRWGGRWTAERRTWIRDLRRCHGQTINLFRARGHFFSLLGLRQSTTDLGWSYNYVRLGLTIGWASYVFLFLKSA